MIGAFNADKPYDQFIREQIAGDLLPAKDQAEKDAHLIATGFLALGPKGLNERNREQFRMDLIDEQIDATSRAVLGVTVACARCHDHKFDPIPQREYYSLAGIFRSTETRFGTAGGPGNKNGTALLSLGGTAPAATKTVAQTGPSAAPSPPAGATPTAANREDAKARVAELLAKNPKLAKKFAELPPEKKAQARKRLLAQSAGQPAGKAAKKNKGYQAANQADVEASGPQAMGVTDGAPSDARLYIRGEIDSPSDTVPRGFLTVLTNGTAPSISGNASGRLELAQWLTAPANSLTARVMVNRAWQHLFGQGLVRTPDNFGTTGEKPSHPELLDTLAVQFMRPAHAAGGMGWSVKKLIRTLVLSRTYQLSSAFDKNGAATDPDNALLWRATPRRLDAEAIRDAMLAASGQLDLKAPQGSIVANIGDGYIGRGIRPEAFSSAEARYRSVYLPIVRDFVPEALEIFDFAEPSLVVAARDVTNVPSQALFLMNSDFVRAQADAMGRRIVATPLGHAQRIALAYELALGRKPTAAEATRAEQYLLNEARIDPGQKRQHSGSRAALVGHFLPGALRLRRVPLPQVNRPHL